MTIHFMEPLSRAWSRMKQALFHPFDLHKWFVVGFNAFLAGLMDATNGSGGGRFQKNADFRGVVDFPRTAWHWLMDNPGWAIAILFAVVVAVVVIVVLTWVSSRGVFMFLDNVARNSVEIVKPWREYRKEGDSLFVWRLVFGIVTFIAFGGLVAWFFIQGKFFYDAGFDRAVPIGLLIGLAFLALVLALIVGYVVLFLKDFVAALMYKHRITVGAAWRMFLGLFRQYPFHFLGYGIVLFFLVLGFVFVVIAAGIVTCCIGWLVLLMLVVPYIGTVVTLPFWYWLRLFSLEFLAQFGPEYDVFPRPAEPAAPAAEAPAV
jgi:hypothetical protein